MKVCVFRTPPPPQKKKKKKEEEKKPKNIGLEVSTGYLI